MRGFTTMQVALADLPTHLFTIESEHFGRSSLAVSAGATIAVLSRATVSADYHAWTDAPNRRQLFSLGVGF